MAHGNIHWSELVSADVEGSKRFFTEIFGWTTDEMPMPSGTYNVCMAEGVPVAGIIGIDQIESGQQIQPHWMTYVAVDDVDAIVGKVAANGGTLLREPFDVPEVGRIAIIMDPGQGVCGIMSPAAQD